MSQCNRRNLTDKGEYKEDFNSKISAKKDILAQKKKLLKYFCPD